MIDKNNLHSITLVSISLILFSLFISSIVSADSTLNISPTISETQISNKESGCFPAIYGDNIVWQKGIGGSFADLAIYNISTQKETQITTSILSVPREPKIYGDKIVYIDSSNEGYDIYMYNRSTSKRTQITTNGSASLETAPAIYSDRIVWKKYYGSGYNIYMYDLATNKKNQIITHGNVENNPSIYEDKVVWEEGNSSVTNHDTRWFKNDIYVYDISTNDTTKIVNGEAIFYRFLPIYGDNIVWQNGISGNTYAYNLSTKTNTLITSHTITSNTEVHYPAIYEDRIVWTDLSSNGNTNIFLYNLSTSKVTQITTDKLNKIYPAIYGDKIVWVDYSSNFEVSKIYMCTIFDTQIANFKSNITMGYSPLAVQFTDISQNATGWSWDFGDGTTSTERNPMHKYSEAGTYNVKLTISSGGGTYSTFATIYALATGPCAYITNSGSDNVSVIDTVTNKVIATVNVGFGPIGVAVNPVKNEAYVTNTDGTVCLIDTATNKVTAKVYVGAIPAGITVTSDGRKVYVANEGNNSVSVIDTKTNKVIAIVPAGDYPYAVSVNPAGTELYVTNPWSNNVSVIDTATNNVTATVNVGSVPKGLVVAPNGKMVYVTNVADNNVSVIDTTSNIVIASVKVGQSPLGLAVTPDGTKVYVTIGDDNVSVIDTATNTLIAEIKVGSGPWGIAVTPDGTKAYVTNYGSNNVSVIDTATNNVISTMSVGYAPIALGQFIGGQPFLPVNNTLDVEPLLEISPSPEHHGSTGTSSGGGGSPEPASNVEVKELSQTFVSSGSYVKFNFPKNVTSVVSVSFDSKKTAGKATTSIEMLKNKSSLTSDTPVDEVYKYLNIWVGSSGFGTSKNFENAVVCFKVEKSWVQAKKLDQSSITLNLYSNKKWNQLSTNLSAEDDNYLYFKAKTPGFSSFAITGKTTATGTTVQLSTGTKTQPQSVNKTLNKTGNKTVNAEQTIEKKQSSNTSGKENTKMPDFEIFSGAICLLSVFLYKKR